MPSSEWWQPRRSYTGDTGHLFLTFIEAERFKVTSVSSGTQCLPWKAVPDLEKKRVHNDRASC